MGTTAPNPMVGAVIVYNEKIIGEGFTSAYGGAHAEVNAINAVADKSLLRSATLYVTLEPCSHFGKTPPCADLIIAHKIPKVVVGIIDPHEKVAGKGIDKLRKAGCEVIVNVCEDECREHHKRFLTFHQKKRPYIILKWAETLDGYVAPMKTKRKSTLEPFLITNAYARQLVHKWRSEEQAILVGTNTVLEDNPRLDVRFWQGKNPIRIVLDKNLRIKNGYHVIDGCTPTMVFTQALDIEKQYRNIAYEVIEFKANVPAQICEVLYKNHITSVLVEGGTQTLQGFIDAGLWDEARVFTGRTFFNSGIKAPTLSAKLVGTRNILTDELNIFRP